MIKGFLLKNKPNMEEISEADVMSQLDPLKECEDKFDFNTVIGDKQISTTRRSFYTDSLYITTYTADNDVLSALWEVYNVLNRACGNLIKSFVVGNALFVVYPRYEDDKFEDATYSVMIEELVRVAAFFCKEFGVDDMSEEYVKRYVSLCVSYDRKDR